MLHRKIRQEKMLEDGHKVEWYVKKMEFKIEEMTLYSGEVLTNKIYPNGKFKDHETDLLTLYKSKSGSYPVLSSNSKMKFDGIVTNPPYADSSHTESKNTLWRKWFEFDELLNDDGVFAEIIPSSWMGSPPIMKKHFLNEGELKEI